MKTGTGSATDCTVNHDKPVFVAVPVPVFIQSWSATVGRIDGVVAIVSTGGTASGRRWRCRGPAHGVTECNL
jgi:hypothetical protein